MKFLSLILSVVIVSTVTAATLPSSETNKDDDHVVASVCYGDLGCFSTDGHFYDRVNRPLQLTPESPEKINTKFALYRRNHVLTAQYLVYNDDNSLSRSDYDGREDTVIIIHGFLDKGEGTWMIDLKKDLLTKKNYNVIQLDWSGGNQWPYTQATANTRVVGAVVARMIKWLEQKTGTSREKFHLAGHSLGSHISGYAGERLRESTKQLGRITGLDPAGPYFENTHYTVRLDPTDARFVDAIHTDGDSNLSIIKLNGGFGLMQPVGHIDFYPNGGMKQPDCITNPILNIIVNGIIEGTKWTVDCYHLRVRDLFTNTILNHAGDYQAYPCNNYEDFQAGKCLTCGTTGCARMGFRANEWNPHGKVNVKMFLDTTGKAPFATHHYAMRITLSPETVSKAQQYGELFLTFLNSAGQKTGEVQFASKVYYDAGKTYEFLGTNPDNISNISKIIFRWKHQWWFAVSNQRLFISQIEVREGLTQKRTCYRGENNGVLSDASTTLLNTC